MHPIDSPTPGPRRRRLARWVWRGGWVLLAIVVLGFAGLNALAFVQARSLLHFTLGGERPRPPQTWTWREKLAGLLHGVAIPKPANRLTPAAVRLPFTTHTLQARDGVRLEAWYTPARGWSQGLVVVVHGFTGCKGMMLPEGRFFHDQGYDVLWLDCRASGGSEGEWTTIGYHEAMDVAAAVAYARATWAPARLLLYGQSMGAAAALRAVAIEGVQADGLILESMFDNLLTTVSHRVTALGVPDWGFARLLVYWGGVQAHLSGFAHNPADYARRVSTPTLLLWGDRDPFVTREETASIYERLGGTKTLAVLPGVAHVPGLPATPRTWKAAVRGFLATVR